MRRRLLAALAAACLTAPALALAADTDPQKRLTPADQAKARTFLLQQADLGRTWKRLPAAHDESSSAPATTPTSRT